MLKPIKKCKPKTPTVPSGVRLQYWRERRGMSRKKFAFETGLTHQYIKLIELRRKKLPRKHLRFFAEILDCEYDDLLTYAKR